jgi:uncharacterized protein
MALVYLDTSAVLSLHVVDVHTSKVTDLMQKLQKSRHTFAVSSWVRAEAASALGIMVRRKDLTAALASQSFEDVQAFCDGAQTLPITAAACDQATRWMLNFDLGLRAGDALHAAITKLNKAQLLTCDKLLVKIGDKLGIKVLAV